MALLPARNPLIGTLLTTKIDFWNLAPHPWRPCYLLIMGTLGVYVVDDEMRTRWVNSLNFVWPWREDLELDQPKRLGNFIRTYAFSKYGESLFNIEFSEISGQTMLEVPKYKTPLRFLKFQYNTELEGSQGRTCKFLILHFYVIQNFVIF